MPGCEMACVPSPTLMNAVRGDAPVFACAENESVADPVPDWLDAASVSHEALLAAVHAHADPLAVRATLPVPPATGIDCEVVGKVYWQGAVLVPACVKLYDWPPIVREVVRALVDVFAVQEKTNAPGPVPLDAPACTESHEAPLDAFQPHASPFVATLTTRAPAVEGSAVEKEAVTAHAAAACVKMQVCPATTMLAVRATVVGFAV